MSTADRLNVAALTSGRNVPSARFRVRQLIPALQKNGVYMHEFIPRVSKYPPATKWLRPLWGGAALAARIPAVMATHGYDVVFLQRELVSTFLTLEFFTKRPRVLDVDDAIFLYRRGHFVERLAHQCDLIVCGNDYPKKVTDDVRCDVIGWTGTSSNFKYLYEIESALATVLKACPDVILRVIADIKPTFRSIPERRINFIRWSPENEVKGIQSMSIGIMPLTDSAWARGKCSFKMLQYMACGVPVVVSPVGMNLQVLSLGAVGLGASNQNEWIEALVGLLVNEKQRVAMGINGRSIVEERFSIQVVAPCLGACLRDLVA